MWWGGSRLVSAHPPLYTLESFVVLLLRDEVALELDVQGFLGVIRKVVEPRGRIEGCES